QDGDLDLLVARFAASPEQALARLATGGAAAAEAGGGGVPGCPELGGGLPTPIRWGPTGVTGEIPRYRGRWDKFSPGCAAGRFCGHRRGRGPRSRPHLASRPVRTNSVAQRPATPLPPSGAARCRRTAMDRRTGDGRGPFKTLRSAPDRCRPNSTLA